MPTRHQCPRPCLSDSALKVLGLQSTLRQLRDFKWTSSESLHSLICQMQGRGVEQGDCWPRPPFRGVASRIKSVQCQALCLTARHIFHCHTHSIPLERGDGEGTGLGLTCPESASSCLPRPNSGLPSPLQLNQQDLR